MVFCTRTLQTRHGHLRRMAGRRSEEHTSELQSQSNLVCRLLLEKKKKTLISTIESNTLLYCNKIFHITKHNVYIDRVYILSYIKHYLIFCINCNVAREYITLYAL